MGEIDRKDVRVHLCERMAERKSMLKKKAQKSNESWALHYITAPSQRQIEREWERDFRWGIPEREQKNMEMIANVSYCTAAFDG